jgi:hypothetical protein
MSGWPGGGWAAGVVLKTGPRGGGVAVAVAAVAIITFRWYWLMEILIQKTDVNEDELFGKSLIQCASAMLSTRFKREVQLI